MSQSSGELLFQQAAERAGRGDFDGCVQKLEEAVAQDRRHIDAHGHLAWLRSQQGEYRRAVPLYFRLVILRPLRIEIWLRFSQCLWMAARKRARRIAETSKPLAGLFGFFLSLNQILSIGLAWIIGGRDSVVARWMAFHREWESKIPINDYEYYKVSENRFVVESLRRRQCETVLDLGSGRSAFPAFLLENGFDVTVGEIEPAALSVQRAFRDQPQFTSLNIAPADFLGLPFADDSFDAVAIISSIEHVPDDGDSRAMKEIARVIKPGGAALVTVPAGPRSLEQWTRHSIGHVYQEASAHGDAEGFLRVYDRAALQARLIAPSGLSVETVEWVGETSRWGWLGLGRNFIDHKNEILPSVFAGPLNLLFAKKLREDELAAAHWAVACLILNKPKQK